MAGGAPRGVGLCVDTKIDAPRREVPVKEADVMLELMCSFAASRMLVALDPMSGTEPWMVSLLLLLRV